MNFFLFFQTEAEFKIVAAVEGERSEVSVAVP